MYFFLWPPPGPSRTRWILALDASSRLCEILLVQRKLEAAEVKSRELYEACLEEGSYDLIHLARSTLARNEVGLLYGQRRFFEAAEYAVRSLELNTAEFGVDHEDTVLDAKILCKIRRRCGDARCAACGAREPKPMDAATRDTAESRASERTARTS